MNTLRRTMFTLLILGAAAFVVFGVAMPFYKRHEKTLNTGNTPVTKADPKTPRTAPPMGWHEGVNVRMGVWAEGRSDMMTGPRQPGQPMNVYACNTKFQGATVTVVDREINVTETHSFPAEGKFNCKKFEFTDVGFALTVTTKGGKPITLTAAASEYQVASIYLFFSSEDGKIRAYVNGPEIELTTQTDAEKWAARDNVPVLKGELPSARELRKMAK